MHYRSGSQIPSPRDQQQEISTHCFRSDGAQAVPIRTTTTEAYDAGALLLSAKCFIFFMHCQGSTQISILSDSTPKSSPRVFRRDHTATSSAQHTSYSSKSTSNYEPVSDAEQHNHTNSDTQIMIGKVTADTSCYTHTIFIDMCVTAANSSVIVCTNCTQTLCRC